VNGPAVDARARTVVVAWFTAPDVPRVRVAFSKDAGRTFGPPVEVASGDITGRVDVVLLDDGRAIVSWLQPSAGGAEIRAQPFDRNGPAGAPVVIASSSVQRASGFPQMVRAGGGLLFAWTDTAEPAQVAHRLRQRYVSPVPGRPRRRPRCAYDFRLFFPPVSTHHRSQTCPARSSSTCPPRARRSPSPTAACRCRTSRSSRSSRANGTGPDIWRASVRVLDAAVAKAYGGKRKIHWMEVYAGQKSNDLFNTWLPDETVEACREYLVSIKGPLTTPIGGGIRSLNVALAPDARPVRLPAPGALVRGACRPRSRTRARSTW